MGMMAVATSPPDLADAHIDEDQGRLQCKTSSKAISSTSWRSNDTTASTHDDLGSTDDESVSTDGEHEDYDDESENSGATRRESTIANPSADGTTSPSLDHVVQSESGFRYEQELEQIGQEGLVSALANVLMHLASLGCRTHRATIFHAATPPQISVQDYLGRIAKYYHCSHGCLILGLIYIDRLVKMHSDFVVSSLNIHRLLSTSIMLAAKFHDDVFYSNKYYGKVAGLKVNELNRLEETFLQLLNWHLHVLPDEYDEYLGRVLLPTQRQQRT